MKSTYSHKKGNIALAIGKIAFLNTESDRPFLFYNVIMTFLLQTVIILLKMSYTCPRQFESRLHGDKKRFVFDNNPHHFIDVI